MSAAGSRLGRLERRAELAASGGRLATAIALVLAAASTGVVVPVLRPLVEETGHGSLAAGVFSAAHVVGGVLGAMLGARALRRAGSARRLAAAALIASVAATIAMASVASLELRVALRLADGACHLLAITAVVAAATAGDPVERARRAVIAGVAIVLGVGGGIGLGGAFHQPAAALVMAAALSAAALVAVVALPRAIAAAPPSGLPPGRARHRGPIAPGLLAFCERFSFGGMTVAMSFLAPPARVGLVLGAFMAASVLAMAVAWRFAPRLGPRKLAARSALGFALALAAAAAIDVLASPGRALLWALAAGASAGSLYAAALVLATRSAELADRARGMATVHAAGSAGHALGALSAGALAFALPGMLVIAAPGIAVVAAAAIGVWLTVPEAARGCPVIGGPDAREPVLPAHRTIPP